MPKFRSVGLAQRKHIASLSVNFLICLSTRARVKPGNEASQNMAPREMDAKSSLLIPVLAIELSQRKGVNKANGF